MQGSIVDQGVELMVFGMSTVVFFLVLLIMATNLMSWLLGRYFPEAEVAVISTSSAPVAAPLTAPLADDSSRLMAVITAAVHRHRVGKK